MDQAELRRLMREFYDSPLSLLEFEDGDTRVKMKKPVAGQGAAPASSAAHEAAQQQADVLPTQAGLAAGQATAAMPAASSFLKVNAPLVGVFYAASAPGEKPYVAPGDHVAEGDVLCLIEAMKMINEIKAPASGTVRFIAPRNGETVGYGDLLMEIEADD